MKLGMLSIFVVIFILAPGSVALGAMVPIKACSEVVAYKGEAYFCGEHHQKGREVFRSNGQPEGTFLLHDIDLGPGDSSPSAFFELNGFLYFVAENTASGFSLWRSDGTPNSLTRIASLSRYAMLVVRDTERVFLQDHNKLFVTDGTPQGTRKLDAIVNQYIGGLTPVPATTYFLNEGDLFYVSFDKLYKFNIATNTNSEVFSFPFELQGCYGARLNQAMSIPGRLIIEHSSDGCNGDLSVWLSDGTSVGTRTTNPPGLRILAAFGNDALLCSREDSAYYRLSGVSLSLLRTGVDAGQLCSSTQVEFSRNGIAYFSREGPDDDLWMKDLSTRPPKKFMSFQKRMTRRYAENGNEWYMSVSSFGNADEKFFRFNGLSSEPSMSVTFDTQRLIFMYPVNNQLYMLFRDLVPGSNTGYAVREGWMFWKLPRGGSLEFFKRMDAQENAHSARRTWAEGGRMYFQLSYNGYLWHSNGTSQSTYRLSYLVPDFPLTPEQQAASKFLPAIELLLMDDD